MDPTSDAAARWLATAERVQRGLNHALSNRVAAIAAVAAVLDGADPDLVARLRDEAALQEELLRAMRLLPRAPEQAPEPVMAHDIIHDAVMLARQVAEFRDTGLDIGDEVSQAPPLRCRPQALLHALTLLLVAVGDAGGALTIGLGFDDAAVTFSIGVAPGVPSEAPGSPDVVSATAAALMAADGALVWPVPGGYRLRLPTLAALRARERALVPSAPSAPSAT